jgi:hypothetical protein
MSIKMLAPSEIWADYEPEGSPINLQLLNKRGNLERYTFDADIQSQPTPIYARVNRAKGQAHTILIAGSYYAPTDESLTDNLVSCGYNVVEIDYTGIFPDSATAYPQDFSYGHIEQAGSHLTKLQESALDTSLYLYTKVFRRAITFTRELIGWGKIILLGIKEGADVAICAAGLDRRADGLVCLNGAAYSEYLQYNYHDPSNSPEKEEERIAYLMGASSSAYAKLIRCPVVIGVGSNSESVDIDRLANFLSLLPEDVERVFTITPRAKDYIDNFSYNAVRNSIGSIIEKKPLASNPLIKEKLQEEDLYLYITERSGLKPESVGVYISFCENDRRYRNYVYQSCEMAGVGEYITKVPQACGEVLAFGEVIYEDGSRLSTLPVYVETEEQDEAATPVKRLLYSNTDSEHTFAAVTSLPVLFGEGIKRIKNKLGLTELSSATNDLITYEIGDAAYVKEDALLQIELKNASENDIEVILGEVREGRLKEYFLSLEADAAEETFEVFTIEAQDAKDKELIALKDFSMVKYIRIKGEKPFAIGNIILI